MAEWENFPHGADIGVRGVGETEEEAFAQAALALTAVILDPASVDCTERVEIFCRAPDHELLFVNWLNEIIYEMATRRMVFGRYEVSIEGQALRGELWGEIVNTARHEFTVEVKGATFTELKVGRRDDGLWIAQCIVDV